MVQSFRFRMTATHAERAQELLALIESRTTYLISQSHWAARLLLVSETKEATAPPVFLTPGEIERYAPQWAHLIPDDPELRAAVGHQLAQKYGCTPPSTPRLWAALGLDQPAVQAAYHRLYGKPLEALDALPAAPAAPEAVSAGEADEALLRDIMAEMEGGAPAGDGLCPARLGAGEIHERGFRTADGQTPRSHFSNHPHHHHAAAAANAQAAERDAEPDHVLRHPGQPGCAAARFRGQTGRRPRRIRLDAPRE